MAGVSQITEIFVICSLHKHNQSCDKWLMLSIICDVEFQSVTIYHSVDHSVSNNMKGLFIAALVCTITLLQLSVAKNAQEWKTRVIYQVRIVIRFLFQFYCFLFFIHFSKKNGRPWSFVYQEKQQVEAVLFRKQD